MSTFETMKSMYEILDQVKFDKYITTLSQYPTQDEIDLLNRVGVVREVF